MWLTKNAFFREMQFWLQCYTVVSYQTLFRLSVYEIQAVYLSGAEKIVFLHDTRLWVPDYQLLMCIYLMSIAVTVTNMMTCGFKLYF